MVIKPKIRGFICTNAHPVGCEAHVNEQIAYVKAQGASKKKGQKKRISYWCFYWLWLSFTYNGSLWS